MSRSTHTLLKARSRLTTWRAKIDALILALDELEQEERESLAPLHQSLRDRFQRIETTLLKLGQLEVAWSGVGVDLRKSLHELESAYGFIASRIDARHGSPATRLPEAQTLQDSD